MKNKASNKIELDKYFTPVLVANKCWDIIDEVIGLDNIDVIIDSSVGSGAFCNYEKRKPDYLIDIKPDKEEINGKKVIKADFLKWIKNADEVNWFNKKVLVGFNPPYGDRNYYAQQFYKSCINLAEWIAFILPINQLNNSYTFQGYNLIKSVDLGEEEYSGVKLHCCFNIYEKPKTMYEGVVKTIESSDIKIYRHDQDIQIVNSVAGGKKNIKYDELKEYDIRICYWGDGSCGKILKSDDRRYAGEYKIVIDKKNKDRDKIIEFIKTHDWKSECKSISMKRLSKQDILNVLAKKFDINQTKEKTILDFIEEANKN